MSIATIIARSRHLHKIKNEQISKIPVPIPTFSGDTITNGFKDTNNFNNDEGGCLLAAVNQFSIDIPRERAVVVSISSGVVNWSFNLRDAVSDWDSKTHKILRIQFNLDRDDDEFFFDQNDWRETINPINEEPVLRFVRDGNERFTPSNDFAIHYSCPHTFDHTTNTSTIPSCYEELVATKCAEYMLRGAAAIASQFSDQVVFENRDLGQLAQRLNSQADIYAKTYEDKIPRCALSPTFIDLDSGDASPFGDMLTFPNRSH